MTPLSSLDVSVSGDLWWGGFTAELVVANTSSQEMKGWSYSFDSPHQLSSEVWGASLEAEVLPSGLTRYTLRGIDWAEDIPAGGTVTVGFNGIQGSDLGRSGGLTKAMLMDAGYTPMASDYVILDYQDHGHELENNSVFSEHIDITSWGTFHGSNCNSQHDELVGGRTAITTEALDAYNGLRTFFQLDDVELNAVGEWAFAKGLTSNSQAWGDDVKGVGLWYAMQGAKVAWIAEERYSPQILADVQRAARVGDEDAVLAIVREFGHDGLDVYLESSGLKNAFINTLKMEPHYGGWMHGRAHSFLDVEGVAIAHDINHLTVLDWDQRRPFMNDTFDWPQWPALDVSGQTVINYYQAIVRLGDPLDQPVEAVEIQPVVGLAESDLEFAQHLDVDVSGQIWWGGFTAELEVTNTGPSELKQWSFAFESPHEIQGQPWGAQITSTDLGNGLFTHVISGHQWGESIGAGETITVGFNGTQGQEIGHSGDLTAVLLFSPAGLDLSSFDVMQQVDAGASQPPAQEQDTSSVASIDSDLGPAAYEKALAMSLLFYEANRSGDLDEAINRIPWRGDSGLNDGNDGIYFGDASASNLQAGLRLDLTGGYHDAGDHVKFGLPLASTLSSLAWGGLAFSEGYAIAGQTDELLDTVRWGTDYLLKAHQMDSEGKTEYFVVQVGDGHADHALWSSPESQSIPRPALAITAEKPGSDVAAASAAALAASSMLFRDHGDVAYADELLSHAQSLFDFAEQYQGKYSDSIPSVQPFYNSWSGFQDELAFGGLWLARGFEAAEKDGSDYRIDAQDRYHAMIGGLNTSWAPNWDDASYGTAVLLAQDMDDQRALFDVSSWLDTWVSGDQGPQVTEGGLRFVDQWGSLRYSANTSMLAGIVADSITNPGGVYSQLAVDAIDYILGDNPRGSSYMVGFGMNSPQQPHHRAASGVGWDGFNSPEANAFVLHGALVGGPSRADDFAYTDQRSDYISNEVAIDYNSGLTGALAFAAQQMA